MAFSRAIGRHRSAVPPCAFLATAALTVLLAAQAQLACSRQVVVSMPGMEMPDSSGVALCPIALVLGLAAAILTAAAAATLVSDPHRRVTGRALVRRYAAFSFARAAGTVLALGSGSVGLMIVVDGNAPAGAASWLLLAGMVVAVAFATTLAAFVSVRAMRALGDRLAVALARELAVLERGALVPAFAPHPSSAATAHRVPLLAARRGLRAPPLSAR